MNHNKIKKSQREIRIGITMKELGFEHTERGNVPFYKVIPQAAA